MAATRILNGATVRVIRELLGISQHDLSVRVGISQGSMSHIEAGKFGTTPQTARAIADGLGVALNVITFPVEIACDHDRQPAEAAS